VWQKAEDYLALATYERCVMLFVLDPVGTLPPVLEPERLPICFDFLRKPFEDTELLWRARCALGQLGLIRVEPVPSRALRRGAITYDALSQQVCVLGKPIRLRRAEREVLVYLLKHEHRHVTSDELMHEVLRAAGGGAAARNQIYEVRRKLKAAGVSDAINTDGRLGYSLGSGAGAQ